MNPTKTRIRHWYSLFFLILAGEMIFALPFHVVRYFRPTFMEVFDISNAQLGDSMAIYGILAMIAYFPGGILADRFPTRDLMSISLIATGLGGFYLMTLPDQLGLSLLFGFWGVTTILLFWAAMLKATREWGGVKAQGRAFGFLDGGRGLMAALAATGGVFILSRLMPEGDALVDPIKRISALRSVILYYTVLTILTGILVWLFLPKTDEKRTHINAISGLLQVFRNRVTWLQALIVVCAYSGYRGLDFYSLYGTDILGMTEVQASRFVSLGIYLRPVGAIVAGFLADRFSTKRTLSITFGLLGLVFLLLAVLTPGTETQIFVIGNLIVTFLAVYALRGIYFALFEEQKISGAVTGTMVGVVSVIGFTPDIFFNSIGGRILDASPGITGYHHLFFFLLGFSIIGMVATMMLSTKT